MIIDWADLAALAWHCREKGELPHTVVSLMGTRFLRAYAAGRRAAEDELEKARIERDIAIQIIEEARKHLPYFDVEVWQARASALEVP